LAPTNQNPKPSSDDEVMTDEGVGEPLSDKFSWFEGDVIWTTPLPELVTDAEMRAMIMDGLADVTTREDLGNWLEVASSWIRDNPKDDDVAHALMDATQRVGS